MRFRLDSMKIRIDIDEKLDLSKFQRFARAYIGQMRELEFDIFLKDYRISIRVNQVDGATQQLVTISLYEIRKEGENKNFWQISPTRDSRFQEVKVIKEMFEDGRADAEFESTDSTATVQKLSQFIKTIHKLNGLTVFL